MRDIPVKIGTGFSAISLRVLVDGGWVRCGWRASLDAGDREGVSAVADAGVNASANKIVNARVGAGASAVQVVWVQTWAVVHLVFCA